MRFLKILMKHPIKFFISVFVKIKFLLTKKTTDLRAPLFFGETIIIPAPISLDFFIFGKKIDSEELALANFFVSYLQKGDIFFDIGAHLGYYSNLAHSKGCKVFSFEPNPKIFLYLQLNCLEKDIELFNVAISDENSMVPFSRCDLAHSELSGIVGNVDIEDEGVIDEVIDVKAIKLSSLDVVPNFIKIDAEGSQYKILSSYKDMLSGFDITVATEYNKEKDSKMISLMRDIGYRMFSLTNDGNIIECDKVDSNIIIFKK